MADIVPVPGTLSRDLVERSKGRPVERSAIHRSVIMPMETLRPFALVTGASRGIGAAYARVLANQGYDLLLVARDKERLEQLSLELRGQGSEVRHEVLDLAAPGAAGRLYSLARAHRPSLDLLVHNAGFGLYGAFTEMAMGRVLEMLQLHVTMVTESTRLVLPDMMHRRRGAIIIVSSIAGFFPVPYLTEYAATKAYLNSFCVALAEEVRPYGVTIQACCPGTTETDFHATAGFRARYRAESDSADRVAKVSFAALKSGRSCVTIGWRGALLRLLSRLTTPAWAARRAARMLKPL
jgi:uncharacterized protein